MSRRTRRLRVPIRSARPARVAAQGREGILEGSLLVISAAVLAVLAML